MFTDKQMPPTAYYTLTLDTTTRVHVVSLETALPPHGGVTFHDNSEHWFAVKTVSLDQLVTSTSPLSVKCTAVGSAVKQEFLNNAANLDYQRYSKAKLNASDWKPPSGAPSHDPAKTAVFKADVPAAAENPITLYFALTISSNTIEGITWYAPQGTNPTVFGSPKPGETLLMARSAVAEIPSGHYFFGESHAP